MVRRWVPTVGVLVVLLCGTAEVSAGPSPGASPGARLAGSAAGEGRAHPGRGQRPEPDEEAPMTAPASPPEVAQVVPGGGEAAARQGLAVLPLGAGLVLVGLGLAFIGWRMRRS